MIPGLNFRNISGLYPFNIVAAKRDDIEQKIPCKDN